VGVLLHSQSSQLFWRVLAYTAVLHFVRQQYGWVALYRRRLGVASKWDRVLDDATIYSATLYPLLYWHAHLPREFEWFIAGDFLPGLPASTASVLWPLHIGITAAYVLRQLYLWQSGRPVSAGKNLIVATTWLTWYVGIVRLRLHGHERARARHPVPRLRVGSRSRSLRRHPRGAGPRLPPTLLAFVPFAPARRRVVRGVALGSPGLARSPRSVPGTDRRSAPTGAGSRRATARPSPGDALRARRLDLARTTAEPGAGTLLSTEDIMKNPPPETETTPEEAPPRPRTIPDVDVATPEPDLWGGEGGAGSYPGGPTEQPRPKDRD
jgi:hypothetical protein